MPDKVRKISVGVEMSKKLRERIFLRKKRLLIVEERIPSVYTNQSIDGNQVAQHRDDESHDIFPPRCFLCLFVFRLNFQRTGW